MIFFNNDQIFDTTILAENSIKAQKKALNEYSKKFRQEYATFLSDCSNELISISNLYESKFKLINKNKHES